jgi:chromosome segregation ATPase
LHEIFDMHLESLEDLPAEWRKGPSDGGDLVDKSGLELERWQQEVFELDRYAAVQTRDLNRARGQLAGLNYQNQILQEQIQHLTSELNQQRLTMKQVRQTRQAARKKERQAAHRQINAMRRSASWRVTAPLRALRRLLSR